MTDSQRWLLPEGIEEALPASAERLESRRRQLLDLYHTWGYELVIPPLVEYLESLLTGTGHGLALQTFKLTDQLNGRLMGLRADMTPQVARIAAHQLAHRDILRLCYIGSVVHTRPVDFAGSRSPMQVGCELYGHAGLDGDFEVLNLMLETLRICQVEAPLLDLGHVAIYRQLVAAAGLEPNEESELFALMQNKAMPDLRAALAAWDIDAAAREHLLVLPELNGDLSVLDEARQRLKTAGSSVQLALDDLEAIARRLQLRHPNLMLHFDLAELRGYHYHTGLVFAAFLPGAGQEVARGGRYDEIGREFGRARPATGFSTDLRTLVRLSTAPAEESSGGIFAPADHDPALQAMVEVLRLEGRRVIQGFQGQVQDPQAAGCAQMLVKQNNQWTVVDVSA